MLLLSSNKIEMYISKHKKTIYVIMWGLISLLSSYKDLIRIDVRFITEGDFYCDIITPLLIWTIAFFADYIYTISTVNLQKEELDKDWTQGTYISICLIFVILVLSLHYHEGFLSRVIWILLLFFNIIRLKIASLNIIRERIELRTV